MDKEMLEALSNLLDKKLKPINADIKDMKTDIKKIISKLDEVEAVNATRHTALMNDISDIKNNLNNVEFMNEKILLLRYKLEKLIAIAESLTNDEIICLSQKLDKLIYNYYKSTM